MQQLHYHYAGVVNVDNGKTKWYKNIKRLNVYEQSEIPKLMTSQRELADMEIFVYFVVKTTRDIAKISFGIFELKPFCNLKNNILKVNLTVGINTRNIPIQIKHNSRRNKACPETVIPFSVTQYSLVFHFQLLPHSDWRNQACSQP